MLLSSSQPCHKVSEPDQNSGQVLTCLLDILGCQVLWLVSFKDPKSLNEYTLQDKKLWNWYNNLVGFDV